MNDKTSIEAVFEKRGPFDAVIHFGALKSVGESWKMPLRYYQNNFTVTVLRKSGVFWKHVFTPTVKFIVIVKMFVLN